MSKQEFLRQLRKGFAGLPQDDVEERLRFYGEMIEDRIEEGLLEEEAVLAVGSVDDIVSQVVQSIAPQPKRRLKMWEIILLALGSPIWLSLGIAAVAVIFSIYLSLWSVIISLWAVFGAFFGCSFGGIIAGVIFACNSYKLTGIAMIGAGLVCAGLSIFMFYGCKAITKGILILTKKCTVWIKNCFVKKEEA